MYACVSEIGGGFFEGGAHLAMRSPIPATHPTLQRKRTGAPSPGLRPEVDHAASYRWRRFSLGYR
jgi:hypothetical protein